MTKFTPDPIIGDSRLRYPRDRYMLASLALGLGIDAYCNAFFESPVNVRHAQHQLIATVAIVLNVYDLLVWVYSRPGMIDMDEVKTIYPGAAYTTWLEVCRRVDQTGLTPKQRTRLSTCLTMRTQSIAHQWSDPDALTRRLLGLTGLPAGGWRTFCIIITTASHVGQFQLEGDRPHREPADLNFPRAPAHLSPYQRLLSLNPHNLLHKQCLC